MRFDVHRLRLFVLGVGLGLASSSCGGVPSYASSAFEADDDAWTIGNNGDGTKPQFNTAGGNPNGNICGQDQKDGDLWYFVAPPKFLGNASAAWGKRLTFDLRQGSTYNQIRGRDVVLNGGGLAISINFRFAPGLDWTPYSFRFDAEQGWAIDEPMGTGPAATEQDIKTVLGTLTSVRIRGEFYDGPNDVACLDNVYLGRE
jgi:hypothetical protein